MTECPKINCISEKSLEKSAYKLRSIQLTYKLVSCIAYLPHYDHIIFEILKGTYPTAPRGQLKPTFTCIFSGRISVCHNNGTKHLKWQNYLNSETVYIDLYLTAKCRIFVLVLVS